MFRRLVFMPRLLAALSAAALTAQAVRAEPPGVASTLPGPAYSSTAAPAPTPEPPPLPELRAAVPKGPQVPPTPPPQPPQPPAPAPEQMAALPTAPEGGPVAGGAGLAVASSNVGYIDSAIPLTQFRLRYESAFQDNRPDRAEFLYPKCGCFRGVTPQQAAQLGTNTNAAGPPLMENNINFQDVSGYFEFAPWKRFSAFINVPFEWIAPGQNAHHSGFSDIDFGVKFAAIADCDRYLTGQLRVYAPTGQAILGLGTDHYSIEPALLYYQKVGERLYVEAELRDWDALDGSDFSGNVLRYGVGVSYDIYHHGDLHVLPVGEVVGWTVLSGKEFDFYSGAVFNAAGDEIVNVKGGLRVNYGEHISLYGGYGHALTGAVWYKEIVRFELRIIF